MQLICCGLLQKLQKKVIINQLLLSNAETNKKHAASMQTSIQNICAKRNVLANWVLNQITKSMISDIYTTCI